MDEFELIRRFWEPLGQRVTHPAVRQGIGNDGAVVQVPAGQELVLCVDTLVEGVHFRADIEPYALGWRALAVNLSDLAAMGADPLCYTLAMTLPEASPGWLEQFASGLGELSARHGIQLLGGDMTRGPLTITIQVQGLVPEGAALARDGAHPGDLICVSGSLGDAGEALNWLDRPQAESSGVREVLRRYHYPEPRLALGRALRGRASAAIDVSDGLVADLKHVLRASGCGARVDHRSLPVSDALKALAGEGCRRVAATAGDDYELCFTWPGTEDTLRTLSAAAQVPVTVIGRIESQPGLRLMDGDQLLDFGVAGYRHFPEEEG